MAYQNVGTPRFYIDHVQYLKNINFDFQKWYDDYGFDDTNKSRKSIFNDPDIFTLSPETQKQVFSKHTLIDESDFVNYLYWDIPTAFPNGTNFTSDNVGFFVAMLNHNLKTKGLKPFYERALTSAVVGVTESSIINHNNGAPDENGCSIYEIDNINPDIATNEPFFRLVFSDPNQDGNATDFNIGALLCGFYYDMPLSPDLSLSMNIEFDGFDNTQTLNGGTLTNTRYMGSPWWFDVDGNKVEPWSVGESTGASKRNGRRTWNLKFSYMSDKDLFASNYGSSTYMETNTGYDGGDLDIYNWGQDLVINGTFGSDSGSALTTGDDWSHQGSTDGSEWSISGNKLICDGNQNDVTNQKQEQPVAFNKPHEQGMWKIVFTISSYSAGNLKVGMGGYNFSESFSGNNTYTVEIDPTHESSNNRLYIQADEDFEGSIENVQVYKSNPSDFQYTIDDDDSFSAQVLNKISHGQKFIFQPDNTNNNPDQFAICVLDQDSFSMKRTAYNVYDISMKIKEVW